MNLPGISRAIEAGGDELWTQFVRSRDASAREQLITRYMPLARSVAARLFGMRARAESPVGFSDYLQYARLGLIEAVDRYDPDRGASFETFSSYRIRGAILNGLGKESELAAQRAYWRTHVQERVDSLKPSAFREGGAGLDDFVDLTLGLVVGVLLDLEVDEGPADTSVRANPYACAELAQLSGNVRKAVEQLPERERQLISRHYFGHCEFQTIATEMGVTKARVSQLHAQALARIRKLAGFDTDIDLHL
jgi:RNA polymerase sigma factor FliA